MIFVKTLKNTIQIRNVNIITFFDDMIADMFSNKEFNPIVNELLIRVQKQSISLAFVTQSYFAVPKNI